MRKIKNITVDAIILGYKRESNIPLVIEGIRKQSFVRDIYLFHNAPSKKKISGVINIVSEKNFGCIGRHAIALLSDADYVLFVDDDIELKVDFSKRFVNAVKISPDSIIGLFGFDINELEQKIPYSKGLSYNKSEYYRYVDIIKGRAHFCRQEMLANSFSFISQNRSKIRGLKQDDFIMDDLFLNFTNQLKYNIPSLMIPVKITEYNNLQQNNGAQELPEHYDIRDTLVKFFIKKSWLSMGDKIQYIEENIKLGKKRYKRDLVIDMINKWRKINKWNKIEDIVAKEGFKDIPNLILYNLAGYIRDKKQYNDAIFIYKYLIRCKSDDNMKSLILFNLGYSYYNKKKTKNALLYLVDCLKKNPGHKKAKELIEILK